MIGTNRFTLWGGRAIATRGDRVTVRLSDQWLDELRSRSSLEQVVAEYVPLKQKGRRYWGCCPYHNEKTPSFSVDSEAQLFYCFGCHKGGTVIQFIMDMEHMDFMEAVQYLAERAHMDLPQTSVEQQRSDYATRDDKEQMLQANRDAARYFHTLLWSPEGAGGLQYFYKRGLTDSDIRKFGLGYSPNGWDTLTRTLMNAGYALDILKKAGLTLERNGRTIDMFRDRAMFPIINARGQVIGFGGRTLGDAQPKYMNTSETPVFNKRQGLYAMNWARKERELGHLILVEGYMDTVSMRKNGVQGVVATLGTALTEEQAKLIRNSTSEVWISYDGDSAGQKAALRALDIFDSIDFPARVIDYPSGMDPDDFIKANGLEGFNRLPRLSTTEYRLLRAKDGLAMDTQEGLTEYAMRACTILRNLKNPIEVENYVRKLVRETGYDRETLHRQIQSSGITMKTGVPFRRRSN
ncbi:MAG: DNA primase, partial [Clostridia bacterium]|nr:DNA primase [Clostridia bacterium]